MTGEKRRRHIIDILSKKEIPVSGNLLSKELQVSRQVIVQDIALLRAENIEIFSTTKGYLLLSQKQKPFRVFNVFHSDEQMEDELNIIVDQGGRMLDVIIDHPIYGEIKAELVIGSRQDVRDFICRVKNNKTAPLNRLTDGRHRHTVEANNTEILDKIEKVLKDRNYLLDM